MLINVLYISVIANNDYRLKYWLLSLIGLPIIILLTPFWTIIAEKFNDMGIDDYKRKTFTIHKLTRENKIALKQMGFEYGDFVSTSNLDYKGFRRGFGSIIVLPNGRVNYSSKLNDKEKVIIEIIKLLPSV